MPGQEQRNDPIPVLENATQESLAARMIREHMERLQRQVPQTYTATYDNTVSGRAQWIVGIDQSTSRPRRNRRNPAPPPFRMSGDRLDEATRELICLYPDITRAIGLSENEWHDILHVLAREADLRMSRGQ